MNEEELDLVKELEKLRETWKIKKELIKKESRKRMYVLGFTMFFDILAVILQLLKITNFIHSLIVITICLIVGLAYNNHIGKQIKKIIWTEDIKELQLKLEE